MEYIPLKLGFHTKYILSLWSMHFHLVKVLLVAIAILLKIHSGYCGSNQVNLPLVKNSLRDWLEKLFWPDLARAESSIDRGKYQAGAVFDPSFMQSIGSLLISPVFSPTSLTPIYHLERFHITFIFHLGLKGNFRKKKNTPYIEYIFT